MDFMEAVNAMKNGNLVKVENKRYILPWGFDGEFYILKSNGIKKRSQFSLCHINSKEWIIVKEKITLWDNREFPETENQCMFYKDDIKKALKEFIEWCESKALQTETGTHNYGYKGKAKEIFGKELLEDWRMIIKTGKELLEDWEEVKCVQFADEIFLEQKWLLLED